MDTNQKSRYGGYHTNILLESDKNAWYIYLSLESKSLLKSRNIFFEEVGDSLFIRTIDFVEKIIIPDDMEIIVKQDKNILTGIVFSLVCRFGIVNMIDYFINKAKINAYTICGSFVVGGKNITPITLIGERGDDNVEITEKICERIGLQICLRYNLPKFIKKMISCCIDCNNIKIFKYICNFIISNGYDLWTECNDLIIDIFIGRKIEFIDYCIENNIVDINELIEYVHWDIDGTIELAQLLTNYDSEGKIKLSDMNKNFLTFKTESS
jgi:hypothetical protein